MSHRVQRTPGLFNERLNSLAHGGVWREHQRGPPARPITFGALCGGGLHSGQLEEAKHLRHSDMGAEREVECGKEPY